MPRSAPRPSTLAATAQICWREWQLAWRQGRVALVLLPWLAQLGARTLGRGGALASLPVAALVTVAVAPWLVGDPLGQERRSGRLGLWWSLPLRDTALAGGKLVAGSSLCALGMAAHLWPPASAAAAASWGGGLLAVGLASAAAAALVLAAAALVGAPLAARLAGAAAGLGLWGLGWPPAWLPTMPRMWLQYLSPRHHLVALGQGHLDPRDLVYFLTLTIGLVAIGTSSLCREPSPG